jgi:hypothetical protein
MNRNQILLDGKAAWLTYPVADGPSRAVIRDRQFMATEQTKAGVLNKLHAAYRLAPHYEKARELVRHCLDFTGTSVAEFNANLLREVAQRLRVRCTFRSSSEFGVDPAVRGEERILSVCRAIAATEYVNPIGGFALYSTESFARDRVRLRFIKSEGCVYRQFGAEFVPSLSIIDALMFADESELADMLSRCRKLTREEAAQAA